jgi:isoleucyl-tRNA synthetase
MSNSKGNTVEPFEMLQKYGADTVRWYMMSNSSPWENLKFSEDGLKETQRKFFNTIVNTYSFFAMYANIDGFTYSGSPLPKSERTEMDRWIISRLNSTVKQVDEHLDEYEPTRTARDIEQFVEELSNWYVRRSRRRFWKEGKSINKTAAYQTLYECLVSLAKIISPIAPFMGEWLFRQLNQVTAKDEISVHLSFYPTVEETAIDKQLELRMDVARTVSTVVLRMRNQIDINVRQPLSRIIIPMDEENRAIVEAVKDIILDEVNVKDIQFVDDDSNIVDKAAKPNFPKLGKRLGSKMKAVAAIIGDMTKQQINDFESSGSITLTLEDGSEVVISSDELEIQRTGLEGWSVETQDGITVALDTEISDELLREGITREFMNRVQNMRKEADYDVTDRIIIGYNGSELLDSAITERLDTIKTETLAETIQSKTLKEPDFIKSWDIEGEDCEISIQRTINN